MAWPALTTGAEFYVQFPIYSTVPHSGISDNGSRLVGTIYSLDTPASTPAHPDNSPQYPDQWVFVANNPVTIDYPSPSTTLITNTTARTTAYLYNHFTSGNLYFDLGTTTAYGDLAGQSIPSTSNSQSAWVDWSMLIPGSAYHWRARFITGSGTIYGADQTFATTGIRPTAHVWNDLDGDGDSDVVLRNSQTGDVGAWLMNGSTIASTGWVGAAGGSAVAGTGDFNGDGKADILLRDASGNLGLWFMNGMTVASGAFVGSAGGSYKVAGVGDFNGDGKADILLRDSLGNLGMWIMNGSTITTGAFVGSPGGSYTVAGIGDFNGDGKADILLRDSLGNLGMWIMNGSTITAGAFVGSPGGSYTVVAAADFNGDGKADILLRDSLGNLGMWIMNGATITAGAFVGSPGGSYTVAAAGDYNADGKADILLRDSSGNIGMWIMNGSTITSGAYVGAAGGYTVY